MGMGVCFGFPSPTKEIFQENTLEMRSYWARVLHRATTALWWLPRVVSWGRAETGPVALALTMYKNYIP